VNRYLSLVFVLILLFLAFASWAEGSQPWLWCDIGVGGFPYVTYGSNADKAFSVDAATGRRQFDLNTHIGFAITKNLYIAPGTEEFFDKMFNSGTETDESSYLFSLGIRYISAGLWPSSGTGWGSGGA